MNKVLLNGLALSAIALLTACNDSEPDNLNTAELVADIAYAACSDSKKAA